MSHEAKSISRYDFDFSVEQHASGIGVVRLAGALTLGQFLSLLDLIAAESLSFAKPRLLLDMKNVATLTRFTEQYTMGAAAAAKLQHLEKVAVVEPREKITRNGERPARQGGLDLLVFDEEDAAVRWLTLT